MFCSLFVRGFWSAYPGLDSLALGFTNIPPPAISCLGLAWLNLLNIFNNYLKTRKEVGLSVPSDDLKMKIKSKVRVGTIDNQTIKNLKEIYRYENENQSLRYDTKLKPGSWLGNLILLLFWFLNNC